MPKVLDILNIFLKILIVKRKILHSQQTIHQNYIGELQSNFVFKNAHLKKRHILKIC